MNFFAVIKDHNGEIEVVTCMLDDTILPGVTRASVIELCKEWGIKVSEREFYIQEMVQAHEQGRLLECFTTGTAAVICPISSFTWHDRKFDLLKSGQEPSGLTVKFLNHLTDIQYGKLRHRWQRKLDITYW